MKTFTPKQIKALKPYWQEAQNLRDRYWKEICKIEFDAEEATGVPIEFFHCDGELAGIGDYNRKYKLLQGKELE